MLLSTSTHSFHSLANTFVLSSILSACHFLAIGLIIGITVACLVPIVLFPLFGFLIFRNRARLNKHRAAFSDASIRSKNVDDSKNAANIDKPGLDINKIRHSLRNKLVQHSAFVP
ncbi:unnamed protein product [Protopolystoma xenopodis]|uniref:Uncharacterized protein n=1 Tax=Protopolystoma xenopodis TaxID=117903 RepID=A0A448X1K4_9PLAT|nr:unnamed protein product [Protopolystoma xenopodis]